MFGLLNNVWLHIAQTPPETQTQGTQLDFNILSLIISFIGGGTVAAIINVIRAQSSEKKQRQIKYLEDQLNNLYGPLYFLTSQGEKLFSIVRRYENAYQVEFVDQTYSKDELTHQRLIEECDQTIAIKNEYVKYVENNNQKIKDLLDNKFSFIDQDDTDIFINYFYEYFARLNIERDKKVPFVIHQYIGDISFLHPTFINRVTEKFNLKRNKLENLVKK
jgi:hypothetical protein